MAVRIGELLLKEKRITAIQLQEALNYQKQNGGKLGANLVKMGFVKDEEITALLSKQYGVPSIALNQFEIDAAVIKLVPAETAHRVLFLSLFALQLQDHVQYARLKAADPPAAHWLHDARAVDEVLAWVEGNLPAGAPLASTNPGLVYLRTGRTGVVSVAPASHVDEWKAIGIHYMVSLQPTAPPPKSLGFRRLYEHQRLWVVEF